MHKFQLIWNVFVKYNRLNLASKRWICIHVIDYRAGWLINSHWLIYKLHASCAASMVSIIRNIQLRGSFVVVNIKITQNNKVVINFKRFNNTYKCLLKFWMALFGCLYTKPTINASLLFNLSSTQKFSHPLHLSFVWANLMQFKLSDA